jgi:2-C-methyl-D-erythritol 4-phosphate cytidylyltransferase
MSKVAVILPAAGQSSRFRDKEKKPFVNLDGRPVALRTIELFANRDDVCQTILVIADADEDLCRRRLGPSLAFMNVQIAKGGAERHDSIANALKMLKPEAQFVAIHDAVRPCLTQEQLAGVFATAQQTGAAILAVPVHDTLKKVGQQHKIESTVPRQGLWLAQTPQIFRRDWLEEAYAKRAALGKNITDDAQLVEAAGHPVQVVDGYLTNIKITTKSDIYLADAILKSLPKPKVQGPIHPFAEDQMWK